MYVFETKRLGLRHWHDTDREVFAKMNADPLVMKYFKETLSREKSDIFVDRIIKHFDEFGYGLYAVEEKVSQRFIGFVGFFTATFEAEFTPCVEIGWRLDQSYWDKGYATEAAKACLAYGFKNFDIGEVYSFTSVINTPSVHVMEKIGLVKASEFEHPSIEDGNPLRPHVLYKLDRETYYSS